MPRKGYTQSESHKRKRAKAIEGEDNPAFKDGRRSYRRRAGATPNDGTVVHHKNEDPHDNRPENLERLTGGDRKPGRTTTSSHEKKHRRAKKRKKKREGRSDAYLMGFFEAIQHR